jgi:hypothetical protein
MSLEFPWNVGAAKVSGAKRASMTRMRGKTLIMDFMVDGLLSDDGCSIL